MGAEQSAELPTPAPPAPEKIVHDGFDGEAEMSKDVDDIPKLVDLSALPQSAVLSLTDAPAEEPAFEAPTGSPMVPDDVAPVPSPVKQPIIIETSRTGMSAGSLQGELGGVNFKQGMRVELVGLAGYEKSEAVITSVATSGSRKGQLYVICGKKAMRISATNARVISEPLADDKSDPSSTARSALETPQVTGRSANEFTKGMKVKLLGIEGYEGCVAMITAKGSGSRSRSKQLYVTLDGRALRIWMENAEPVVEEGAKQLIQSM